MNTTQIMGVVRDFFKILGVIAVAYGYVDESTWEMVVGTIVTLGSSVWSWYTNKLTTMAATLADSTDVKKIIATKAFAAAIPNAKVVAK